MIRVATLPCGDWPQLAARRHAKTALCGGLMSSCVYFNVFSIFLASGVSTGHCCRTEVCCLSIRLSKSNFKLWDPYLGTWLLFSNATRPPFTAVESVHPLFWRQIKSTAAATGIATRTVIDVPLASLQLGPRIHAATTEYLQSPKSGLECGSPSLGYRKVLL